MSRARHCQARFPVWRQVVLLFFQDKQPPCDFRDYDTGTQIKTLTPDSAVKISSLRACNEIDVDFEQ